MAQTKTFKKIGVLTSGGDAPGMNAAVRAVTLAALSHGIEVVGIKEGYKGLYERNFVKLGINEVANVIGLGGTFLYSARFPEFKDPEIVRKVADVCRHEGIEGLVAIGGDGTFRGATDLSRQGIPCIGIPGTIDNDISATDASIGFDTAMNTVIELADKFRDTCESHARCNVIEVMGRNAGYIALQTGIASGTAGIAIIEQPYSEDEIVEVINKSVKAGKRSFIVTVSEGMPAMLNQPDFGETLAKNIQTRTGVETKFARLAHLQRGGNPTLRDRYLATLMGHEAVEELLKGHSNLVICLKNDKICTENIETALIFDKIVKGKAKQEELDKLDKQTLELLNQKAQQKQAEFDTVMAIAKEMAI